MKPEKIFLTIGILIYSFSSAIPQVSIKEKLIDDPQEINEPFYRISPDKELIYRKPGMFDFLKNAPSDFKTHANSYIQKKNLPKLGAILASTAVLVTVDQQLLNSAKKIGRDLNIADHEYTLNASPIPELDLFLPTDTGSALYFIGDGFTHLTIDAAFLTYGLLAKDNRALQTASQIFEGLMLTGTYVQILKHISGRESPNRATAPGGVWRVFPNQIKAFKDVPKYDAFPSGHLATVMSTVTIISHNYPEYKFIRPIGYTLMTLLGFQMLNNGVHWMSDYPLALFIGSDIAKIVVRNGRSVHPASGSSIKQSVSFSPVIMRNNVLGFQLTYQL